MTTAARLCACGCERPIPPGAHGKRVYASDACRQRGHRGREAQRARDQRASVQAAVERRGALDLAELLDVAQREARRRPGAVLLRVAGRLVVLTDEDLAQLAEGLGGPAAAPQPLSAPEPGEALGQLRRRVADLRRWPELGEGVRLIPPDAIAAIEAQVEALEAVLARPPMR